MWRFFFRFSFFGTDIVSNSGIPTYGTYIWIDRYNIVISNRRIGCLDAYGEMRDGGGLPSLRSRMNNMRERAQGFQQPNPTHSPGEATPELSNHRLALITVIVSSLSRPTYCIQIAAASFGGGARIEQGASDFLNKKKKKSAVLVWGRPLAYLHDQAGLCQGAGCI